MILATNAAAESPTGGPVLGAMRRPQAVARRLERRVWRHLAI